MSNQPLDPELVIDPTTIASFTGLDAQTGIYLDADQTNSSVLINTAATPAIYIDKFQNVGINTVSPDSQVTVSSTNGDCLQLRYNDSTTNKANLAVSSDGKLALSAGGSEVNVSNGNNFNVKSHNGVSSGLMLNNTLVRSTADQINYNVVTPGSAAASKAVVLDSNKEVTGISAISATSVTGTLQTASQTNVTKVGTLNGVELAENTNLTIGSSTLNETDITRLHNITPGTASADKAVVLDSNKDISGVNAISATDITGTLQTAAQPNITSVGTLSGLDMNGYITGLSQLSVNTTTTGRALVVNDENGNCIQLTHDNASGAPTSYVDMVVSNAGDLLVSPSGGNLDITTHSGTAGLKLDGVLVQSSADELNYVHNVVPGTAAAGKALVVTSARNVSNINNITATTITGTIQTANQPNISSVNALNVSQHDGANQGLALAGTLVTATATEINYLDGVTAGSATASNAVILDSDKSISGIDSLSANSLTGTIQTAAQPNIESVSVLDVTEHNGVDAGLRLGGELLTATASQLNSIFGAGGTGTFQNLTVNDTLNVSNHDGISHGLTLAGDLVTASADQINYLTASTPGTATNGSALVVNSSKDISAIRNLGVTGDLTVGSTVISETDIAKIDDITNGTAAANKALVLNSSLDISGIDSLSANSLTGTLQTAYQPNVTSVDVLDISAHDGGTQGLRLGGELLTATAAQLNSIFGGGGGGGSASFGNTDITGSLDLVNYDGSTVGLKLGGSLVTSSATELNYLDGSEPGVVHESTAVVVDSNKDITGFNNLTADYLYGTLGSSDQPYITSLGTINNLSVTGNFAVDGAALNSTQINTINAVTAGTAAANKALILDSSKNITGINSASMNQLNLSGTVYDYSFSAFSAVNSGINYTSNCTDRSLAAYSPTLGVTIIVSHQAASQTARSYIMYCNSATGFTSEIQVPAISSYATYAAPFGVVWNAAQAKFYMFLVSTDSYNAASGFRYISSTDGITWSSSAVATGLNVWKGTNVTYHSTSNTYIFMSYDGFYYSTDCMSWTKITLTGSTIDSSSNVSSDGIVTIGNYVTFNRWGTTRHVMYWNGSTWSQSTSIVLSNSAIKLAYHVEEDRLYAIQDNVNTGASATNVSLYYIDSVTTRAPSTWIANMSSVSISMNPWTSNGVFMYIPNYNVVYVSTKSSASDSTNYLSSIRVMVFKNKQLTFTLTDGPTETSGVIYRVSTLPIIYQGANNSIIIPATQTGATVRMLYLTPTGNTNGIVFGSTTITEAEFTTIDGITNGSAGNSKALITDGSKNIVGINTIGATQITLGSTTISESEILALDGVTYGTAAASRALITDASRNIKNINSLMLGSSTDSSRMISALSGSTAAGSEAYITLGNANSANNSFELKFYYAGAGSSSNYGSFGINTIGPILYASALNSGSIGIGTSAPAYKFDVSGTARVTNTLYANSGVTLGSTAFTETQAAYLSSVTPGTVTASKALVVDSSKNISTINSLTATTLNGTTMSLTNQSVPFATWTTPSAPGAAFHQIAYSPTLDMYIATVIELPGPAQLNYLYKSTDGGVTWTTQTLPATRYWSGAVWSPTAGRFIVISQANDSIYSSDGTTWTTGANIGASGCYQLTYSASRGYVFAQGLSGTNMYYTTNASSWSALATGGLPTHAHSNKVIAATNFLMFAASNAGTAGTMILRYYFGTDTQGLTNSATISGFGGTRVQYILAYSPTLDRLVALARDTSSGTGALAYLSNPTSSNISSGWVFGNLPAATNWTSAQWSSDYGAFMATGGNPVTLIYSYDGITWTKATSMPTSLIGDGVYRGDFIAVANKTLIVSSSANTGTYGFLRSVASSTLPSITIGTTAITESEIATIDAVTAGTVTASKAVVVDSNKDISSFRNLTATNLTGTIQTASQPNITSVGTLTSVTTSGDLTLGSTVISETDIAKIDVITDGTAAANKALVLDSSYDISGINSLSATNLTGTLQTASQPNITSVGTLTSVTTSGDLTLGSTVISETDIAKIDVITDGTAAANKALVLNSSLDISGINSLSASDLTGTLQTAAQPNITSVSVLDVTDHNGSNMGLSLGGSLLLATASQLNDLVAGEFNPQFPTASIDGNLTISGHNGVDTGLILGSTLVTSTATELNYLDGSTPGSATASNVMVLDSNKNISDINSLSATDLTGTIQTAAQPNITSVGTLTSLNVSGDLECDGNLIVGGTIISESEIVHLDSVVPGTSSALKALVTDEDNSLVGLNAFGANTVSGTIQTSYQPNITSVGTLTSVATSGNVTVGSTVISETDIAKIDNITNGTAAANKALVLDSSYDISGINSLSATDLTGTLQTAAQPNITSVGTLTSVSTSGDLTLGSTVISETDISKIDNITNGTAAANRALVLDNNKDISGINSLSATDLTGTLQTATQPNITSVGTLTSVTTSGDLTLGSTVISETDISKIDNITNGTAAANRALVLDNNKDISGINSLSATNLTGTLQTAYQPNITSLDVLDISAHNGSTQGLRLGGDLLTATAAQLNSIVNGDFSPEFISATVDGNLTVSGHNGTDVGLILGSTLVTSTAAELNYLDGVTPGTATASNAMVLDSNKDISSIRNLSASHLTGTLQTAAQPNITSVGTLTSLNVSGDLECDGNLIVGGTIISESEIVHLDSVVPGTSSALKALVTDEDNSLVGLNVLGASSVNADDLTGTLHTASQPYITSVATLNITEHDGSTEGLSLNGTLVTATATELNYNDVSQGSAAASKALILDSNLDISGIHLLSASQLTGTLQTASQPNITSVGTLTSIATSGNLTLGSTVISETDIAKIGSITNGTASANKALVLDSSKNIAGINLLESGSLKVGSPANSNLPVEIGSVSYAYTGAYAYSNSDNAHGIVDANVSAPSANYSARFDGRILVTGEINITSDRRLKTNVEPLTSEFAKSFILTTQPVKFNWKTDDDVVDYGYIAQDVMKKGFSDIVSVVPDPSMEGNVEDDGFINPNGAKYTMSPGKVVPILALNQKDMIETIETQNSTIKDLEERIAKLEQMISRLV